ncbi:MAG: hypothetical protein ACRDRT_10735 [Pseudonocardiaceae bacterium]
MPNWSLDENDAWIQGHIDNGDPFYPASPETPDNLWDYNNDRQTVFGRERAQIQNAGYNWSGYYQMYVAPGQIAPNLPSGSISITRAA